MKKQRKHYTPEEKVAILRRHLLEQVPISELCDKHGLQPTVFYRWQKEFFKNGALPSSQRRGPTIQPSRNGSSTSRRRSRPKIEVLAELMAKHIAFVNLPWVLPYSRCKGQ
jgi:transposase